jgi:hypothetical protein
MRKLEHDLHGTLNFARNLQVKTTMFDSRFRFDSVVRFSGFCYTSHGIKLSPAPLQKSSTCARVYYISQHLSTKRHLSPAQIPR